MSFDQKIGANGFDIGPVRVEAAAILAPLSGVTDVAFRRIANRLGAGLVVSEMVASDELVQGSEEAQLRAEGAGIEPHVVQLAGCEPHWMAEAARVAEGAGARIIDINMGCPAKRVIGGYAGSALMRDLDHAARLIEATVQAASVPVTVKMRLGWDHDTLNAPELARRAESLGVQAVTVHGRTRQQFYKGQADWNAIAAVVRNVGIPVIANGDIGTLDDARKCLSASGAAAVMIGRSAVGRPWLVGQIGGALQGVTIPDPSPEDMTGIAVEHYEGLLSLYGERTGVRHARKHLAAYADVARASGFHIPPSVRTALVTSEEPRAVTDLLRSLYRHQDREAA
ncbi:tRNA dihydrouridine synthase DusB [Microvirga mediterraneensis]|uniref:tRNA-dihydrouridine synthase n=1 Tax=Microvirga mediterraneensis TaxID=2754695 RepID=A0A838BPR1_9HYPH|nr:tRNA dihydrouridine synthase DusB [Microvirga mediterraneensis]MBA1157380.1 tRNA dihydrouridine synthase DusB [Microvirga mediterraneensis]